MLCILWWFQHKTLCSGFKACFSGLLTCTLDGNLQEVLCTIWDLDFQIQPFCHENDVWLYSICYVEICISIFGIHIALSTSTFWQSTTEPEWRVLHVGQTMLTISRDTWWYHSCWSWWFILVCCAHIIQYALLLSYYYFCFHWICRSILLFTWLCR